MPRLPEITNKKLLAQNWGSLTHYDLVQINAAGAPVVHPREVYDHGSAASVLLLDAQARIMTLVRQHRLPAQLNGDDPMMIEACAGLLDGEAPEICARREAIEETGIAPHTLIHAFDIYASPGSVTEKVHCFLGLYDHSGRVSAGGGLDHEGEDIEILEIGFEEALPMIASGKIIDAKTVALIQHAALQGILDQT